VSSGLQTQRSVWIAGEWNDFSVDGMIFYPGKIADMVVFVYARFCPLFTFPTLRGPFGLRRQSAMIGRRLRCARVRSRNSEQGVFKTHRYNVK